MAQETLDQNKKDNNAEGKKTPKDAIPVLLELDFNESETKPDLWSCRTDQDEIFFWDFRKNKKGNCWCNRDGHPIDTNEMKQMNEYKRIRGAVSDEKKIKPEKKEKPKGELVVRKEKGDLLRGNEADIRRLMDVKMQLDSIIGASSDKKKLGEGMLWHELKFGKGDKQRISVEPSAELVDMIAVDMGNITTEIVDEGQNTYEDPNTNQKILTYYAVVQAEDLESGTTGLGVAEEIVDFNEMNNKSRTFTRTKAVRKAERNAKERLIPVPRKAMVFLIQKILEEHKKKIEKAQ